MELTWPRLASEETAITIVVDKDTRTKVPTTSVIDCEQVFRRMTHHPAESKRTVQFPGPQRLFNRLMRPYAVGSQLWPSGYSLKRREDAAAGLPFAVFGC